MIFLIFLFDDWDLVDVEINLFVLDVGFWFIWGYGFWVNYDEEYLFFWGGSDVLEDDIGV